MSTLLNDIISLDVDLTEVYKEFGSSHVKIVKCINEVVDDLYNTAMTVKKEEYPVVCMVTQTPISESQSNIGEESSRAIYSFKILASSLMTHRIPKIELNDQIKYYNEYLDIKEVKPNIALGDYYLEYEVKCEGKEVYYKGDNQIV